MRTLFCMASTLVVGKASIEEGAEVVRLRLQGLAVVQNSAVEVTALA